MVLVAVSVVWIPILQSANSGQLYVYIQSVTSYLAPPVTAVFGLAVFWKRTNEQGAFWGLMVGLVVGLVRMIMEFIYPVPRCGVYDERPSVIKDVHYLHFAIILCVLTIGIVVVVSLLTEPPLQSHLKNLTWWTISKDRDSPEISMQKLNTTNRASRRDKEDADTAAPTNGSWTSRFCGTRSDAAEEAPRPLHIKNTRSTAEDPFWARVCCVNAIILMCINIFFYAYFA